MTIALSLAERGWIEIDSATVRAHGDVQAVIAEMQTTLKQVEVVSLCSRLGVHSAGFMFFDRFTRMTRFFRTDDTPPSTYATQYISPTKAISDEEFEGIHNLFLLIREDQAQWAKSDTPDQAQTPDYFRCMPRLLDQRQDQDLGGALVAEELGFRDRYAVHYCTLGEMLVTSFLWRTLSRLSQAGFADRALDEPLADLLDTLDIQPRPIWKQIDLFAQLEASRNSDALLKRWNAHIGSATRWRDDWRAVGFEGPQGAVRRAAALRFCQAFDGWNLGVAADLDPAAFGTRLLSILPLLLERLSPARATNSVSSALAALESFARFPILPFFVWNALEDEPHVYCIVPVWTSQAYPFEDNHHLGFALTALCPNRELDWSLRDVPAATTDVDPLIITSLMRLVARPLVEHSLYGALVKWAEETEKERQAKVIGRRLASLNKITAGQKRRVRRK